MRSRIAFMAQHHRWQVEELYSDISAIRVIRGHASWGLVLLIWNLLPSAASMA
jgi:hypothetical protein